jgi:PAS domain S-box-containing protein
MGAKNTLKKLNRNHLPEKPPGHANSPPLHRLISAIIENIRDIALAIDQKGNILYANPAAYRLGGYDHKDLLGKSFLSLFEIGEAQKNQIYQCLKQDGRRVLNTAAIRKDGSTFPVRLNVSSFQTSENISGLILIAVDTSAIKQAMEEQANLVTAVEHAAEAIIVTDIKGTIEYVNPAFEQITGYARTEVINRNIKLLDSGRQFDTFYESMWATLRRGNVWQGRFINKGKNASLFETEATVSPIKDGTGNITKLVSVQRDVSNEVRLEKQLRQAQKMEAIGTLAGGIAHDFNNLLMGIQGNVSLSLLDVENGSALGQNLNKIEQLVQSGVDLTKQLLGFARGGKYEVNILNMNDLLREQNLMFERTNKDVVFKDNFDNDLWSIEVDQGQIEQVILNLYMNALQAMPGGGTILAQTENIRIDKDQFRPYHVKAGNYVKFSLSDSGIGMDEETQQRIFDPFFTTKEMGRGTGLGLASVYGIIKNHEGFINVCSEAGKGTRFEVHLPASEKSVLKKKKPMEKFIEGKGTVLLVDDEEMILDVGLRMLNKLGYEVLTARNGIEALRIYSENQDKIDVIILDMVMPQMNGGDTFDKIKEVDTDAKVLLSSGYSIDGQANEILARGCKGFIQKPFNMQSLSQNIRMVLENK